MAVVYHFSTEKFGEAEGFFKEDGEIIAAGSGNDADWRGEYFDRLLKAFGIDVVYGQAVGLGREQMLKSLGEWFGMGVDDE